MEKTEYSFKNMCGGVVMLSETTPAGTISAMVHYGGYFATFQTTLGILEGHWEFQRRNTTGFREDKVILRTELEETNLDYSSKVASLASFTNNTVLLNEMTFTASDLAKAGDSEIIVISMLIKDRMEANIVALAPYGITALTVTDFNTQIDAYRVANTQPRFEIDTKKDITADMKRNIKELKVLLKKMDREALTVRRSHRAFYNSYKTVRTLTAAPTHKQVIRGKITDKDGNPLMVRMVCEELGIDRMVKNGVFTVKNGLDGDYSFIFTRTDFDKNEQVIGIFNGLRTEVTIVMKAS